ADVAAFFEPLVPPRSFAVMARGGLSGEVPRNTRQAIALAVDDNLEWIEVPLRLSKDNKHVVFGDDHLDRETNAPGPLKERTLAELQKLDAGSHFAPRFKGAKILSLEECLAIAKGKINLCLDCADVDPEQLVAAIKAAGMEPQVVVRDGRERLQRVHDV